MGTGVYFLGIKRTGLEFDKELPTSAEVKNEWSYVSIPVCAFVAWTGTVLTNSSVFILKRFVVCFNQQASSHVLFMVESLK